VQLVGCGLYEASSSISGIHSYHKRIIVPK